MASNLFRLFLFMGFNLNDVINLPPQILQASLNLGAYCNDFEVNILNNSILANDVAQCIEEVINNKQNPLTSEEEDIIINLIESLQNAQTIQSVDTILTNFAGVNLSTQVQAVKEDFFEKLITG